MGNPTSVIAILDSGIAWNYKDLDTSRILPGYDFVIQNEFVVMNQVQITTNDTTRNKSCSLSWVMLPLS